MLQPTPAASRLAIPNPRQIVDACRQGNLLTLTILPRKDGRAYTFPAAIPPGLTDTEYTRLCALEAQRMAWPAPGGMNEDAARGQAQTTIFAEAS